MRPLMFGEVLFDQFPDGTSVLGGAPFNVAWHLRGFGLDPLLVSRIGDDPLGNRISEAMSRWGLDTGGVQIDPTRPTGVVEVELESGQHTFQILPDRAYDFVDAGIARRTVEERGADLVYHGTLALRNPVSQAALDSVLTAVDAPIFLDINLRDPWWRIADLPDLISRARWLKLNEDELERISQSLEARSQRLEDQAAALQERFGLDLLLVTRGEQGVVAWAANGVVHRVEPDAAVDVVDTVGAGDAFSAVMLFGLISDWPLASTLPRAQAFASAICQVQGATVEQRDFYDRETAEWPALPERSEA